MSKLIIRPMFDFDVPAVFAVESASHALPWTRKQLFYDCLRVGYYGVVIEVKEKIIGYGLCSIEGKESHILNLAVLPKHRRLGYGELLVRHLIEMSKGTTATYVVLEVRASNITAIELYKKLGFKQIEVRKDYYNLDDERKEDAIRMSFELYEPH